MEETAKKIIEIIADELSMDENDITMESTFTDDLGADSLDVCQIIMRLEDLLRLRSMTKPLWILRQSETR